MKTKGENLGEGLAMKATSGMLILQLVHCLLRVLHGLALKLWKDFQRGS